MIVNGTRMEETVRLGDTSIANGRTDADDTGYPEPRHD